MADVATLGLAIDSSQVKSATAALNQFNAASNTAAKGADKLAASGQKSETAMRAIEAAAKRSGISTAEMEKRVDAAAAARNRLNAASQAAVKSMETLSVSTKKAANDNQELGKQTEKTRGGMEVFATRLTRGLVAGIALQGVRTLIDYLIQLNSQLAATADTAQRVGVNGQRFQGLQTAAGYKGIGGNDFNSAMMSFNQQVDLAKNGLGDLQALLRSNGRTVSDTATTFGVVADLVRNAGSEAQKFSILQQAGLPATREFAKLMEQGGAAITKQADAATKLSDQQLADAKKIDDEWKRITTDFENGWKRAIVNTGGALANMQAPAWLKSFGSSSFWSKFYSQEGMKAAGLTPVSPQQGRMESAFQDTANLPANSALASALNKRAAQLRGDKPTLDPDLEKRINAQLQQRLALQASLGDVEKIVALKEAELRGATLNLVGPNKELHDAIIAVTRAQAEMSRVQQQAQIGVFNLDAANKAAQDTLKAWVAQKLLDPANEQQMAAARTMLAKSTEQLADAAKVAAAPLEGLQRLINEGSNLRSVLDQGVVSGLNSVENALVDITSGTVTAADGFKNLSQSVIRAIEQMIIKMTIITPLAKALQAAIGGFNLFGGGGGSGFSLTGTGGLFANGGVFPANDNGISRYSNQVVSKPTMFAFANGVGLMGEAGAEAIMPLQRGADGKLGVRAGGGGGDVKVIINNAPSQPSVSQRQNESGGRDIMIDFKNMVRDAVLDDASKNGDMSRALSARMSGFNGR